MKLLLSICAVLVLALTPAAAHAATDVTGSWTGEFKIPDGSTFPVSITLKQEGAKLTGTVQGPSGDVMEITDGKVDGDTLSFKVNFNGMIITHEGTFTKTAEGTVNADEIKLSSKSDSADFPGGEMILKRSKVAAPLATD